MPTEAIDLTIHPIVKHLLTLQPDPRIDDDTACMQTYAWAQERGWLPHDTEIESPAQTRIAFLKAARTALATEIARATVWELREVTHHWGDAVPGAETETELVVVRLRKGTAAGVCRLNLFDRYGGIPPLRLDDGSVRPNWHQYVYFFAKRWPPSSEDTRILARVWATNEGKVAWPRLTFQPYPLQDGQWPYTFNRCRQCGQRCLALLADDYVLPIICRVCGDRGDDMAYPAANIQRARDAYKKHQRGQGARM